jgi:hypothetical protein
MGVFFGKAKPGVKKSTNNRLFEHSSRGKLFSFKDKIFVKKQPLAAQGNANPGHPLG